MNRLLTLLTPFLLLLALGACQNASSSDQGQSSDSDANAESSDSNEKRDTGFLDSIEGAFKNAGDSIDEKFNDDSEPVAMEVEAEEIEEIFEEVIEEPVLVEEIVEETVQIEEAVFVDAVSVEAATLQDAEISYEERINRNYIFIAGYRTIPQYIIEAALKIEAEKRRTAGTYVGYELSDDAIEAGVQADIDQVLAIDANTDFWEAIAGMGFTETSYRREVANRIRVQEMFLPEDPGNWPVADLERLLMGPFGSTWDSLLKKDHESMMAAKAAGEPVPQLNQQTLNQFILPSIVHGVMAAVEVSYPSDGLPEGVALRVGELDIKTDDLLGRIRPLLSKELMRESDAFTDAMILAEESLRESGHWLDEAALAEVWAEELALYEGSFITHDAMVLSFFRFPTMEAYKQYFQVRKSFRTSMPDPFTQEMLDKQIAERGAFLGGGKVQASVLLISAKDPRSGRFAMTGDPMGEAKSRADEVAEILKSGEDYIEVLNEYSDIPDTLATQQQGMPAPAKGKFGLSMRNDLRGYMGESEFSDVAYRGSMTDEIFFNAEIGAVYGPFQVPIGYIFYRVEARADGPGVDPVANPQQDFLVRDDILGTRLVAFLNSLTE
jgi:hypothetical protein